MGGECERQREPVSNVRAGRAAGGAGAACRCGRGLRLGIGSDSDSDSEGRAACTTHEHLCCAAQPATARTQRTLNPNAHNARSCACTAGGRVPRVARRTRWLYLSPRAPRREYSVSSRASQSRPGGARRMPHAHPACLIPHTSCLLYDSTLVHRRGHEPMREEPPRLIAWPRPSGVGPTISHAQRGAPTHYMRYFQSLRLTR